MIEVNIDTILISAVGTLISMLIAMLAFFMKKQIKTIDETIKSVEHNITTLNLDIISFKQASFRECSNHRQTMYNDFYKRDLLDERKEALEQRVKRIEEKMNGHIK